MSPHGSLAESSRWLSQTHALTVPEALQAAADGRPEPTPIGPAQGLTGDASIAGMQRCLRVTRNCSDVIDVAADGVQDLLGEATNGAGEPLPDCRETLA